MLNLCSFIGRLGSDPEIRQTQDGKKIATLSLAVSESWKDKKTGERKERTEWVKIAIFNEGLANAAEQYLRKGSKVYVQGKLRTRKWQDRDGNDRYTTEIVLQGFNSTLTMLDSRSDNQGGGYSGAQGSSPSSNAPSFDDDEIPF